MSLEKLIDLKKRIENSSLEEKIEIFNILKKNKINYTQNKNGIFIILNNIDEKVLKKMYNFLDFLNDTKKKTKEIEDIIVNLNKFKN